MTGRGTTERGHRGRRRRARSRSGRALLSACLILLAGGALAAVGHGAPGAATADAASQSAARVTDRVRLGDAGSEQAHGLVADGATEPRAGTVEQGQLSERYKARTVAASGRFELRLDVLPDLPLTLQFRELRPRDAWGAAYGFRVYLDGRLAHVRDNATQGAGGGVYRSFFLDTRDPAVLNDGEVTVTVEGTSGERAHFTDIWAYSDLPRMVGQRGMRVTDRLVFALGQDYRSDAFLRARLDYIKATFQETEQVKLGLAVLDYFPVRSPEQMAANYQRYLRLSREYDMPFAIESTSDWEGTPKNIPDGKGGFFGDLEYQQILWSPQDQTGPDKDVYRNPAGEVQRLDEFLGAEYEPRHGLSWPNIWGNMPWLTFHHPDLNAFYERKANESMDQFAPLLWNLQRSDEADRVLPFSTATETVYWSRRNGEGVWDIVYTNYNNGVERTDIYADLNPHTMAAAEADGVTLDPTDGWSEEERRWLYRNQSHHQQLFADIFYYAIPRERITVSGGEPEFPADMLRHNVHSEIYSRKQEPYYSGVYPSTAQSVVEHARPGAQFISLDNYSPGGFYHLQRLREFGRIANPNLENAVSAHAPDKTLLLRQAYVNGSRYTTPYNWRTEGSDESKDWIAPFLADMDPWDVVHDAPADGRLNAGNTVTQTFTAGELRLVNRIDVRLQRTGAPAPLRLTVLEGDRDGRVVTMRHLGATEIRPGWVSFYLPIEKLDRGQEYTIEIEQVGGGGPAYAYPTAGGELLYRVGLDMDFERDRSLVIQWRRDAGDAIRHVGDELGDRGRDARIAFERAERALADDRYVDAYRLAMRADSLRFPVLYQSSGRSTLDPFPITVESEVDVDIDVAAHEGGRDGSLEMAVRGYAPGTVDVLLRDPPVDARVTVDGVPQPARMVGGALRFAVELPDTERHEVVVRP